MVARARAERTTSLDPVCLHTLDAARYLPLFPLRRAAPLRDLGSDDDSEDREYVRGLFEAECAEAMSYEGA